MPKVTFNSEECKACGLCVNVCPKKILQLSDKLNEKAIASRSARTSRSV